MSATEAFLLAFGGNAAMVVVLAFLARSLVTQWLAKDIKRFESELQQASDAATQSMKHRLSLVAHEHSVRFNRLHEKRAQVLEEVYSRLLDFEEASAALGLASDDMPEHLLESALRRAEDSCRELTGYIRRNELHIPEETSAHLQRLVDRIMSLLSACSFNLVGKKLVNSGRPDLFPEVKDAWVSVHRYLEHEAPAMRAELVAEFRGLLGATAQ